MDLHLDDAPVLDDFDADYFAQITREYDVLDADVGADSLGLGYDSGLDLNVALGASSNAFRISNPARPTAPSLRDDADIFRPHTVLLSPSNHMSVDTSVDYGAPSSSRLVSRCLSHWRSHPLCSVALLRLDIGSHSCTAPQIEARRALLPRPFAGTGA